LRWLVSMYLINPSICSGVHPKEGRAFNCVESSDQTRLANRTVGADTNGTGEEEEAVARVGDPFLFLPLGVVKAEVKAVSIVTPALGPSFGTAPSGT